jgi:hypothetical protein
MLRLWTPKSTPVSDRVGLSGAKTPGARGVGPMAGGGAPGVGIVCGGAVAGWALAAEGDSRHATSRRLITFRADARPRRGHI